MKQKVVLAFSGGLDTSFCVPYLIHEKGLEVHTAIVNTGGFSEEEAKRIEERALQLGATTHTCIDAVEDYYQRGIRYLIFGNVLKNNTYPLSVSSERFFQALNIVEHIKKTGADYVAHGSTGAGNDQIRFDLVFEVLAPEVKILALFASSVCRDNRKSITYGKRDLIFRGKNRNTPSIRVCGVLVLAE